MMTTAAYPGGELQNIRQLFAATQTVHHRFPLLLFYLKEKSLILLFFFLQRKQWDLLRLLQRQVVLKSGGGVDIFVVVGVIPIIFVLIIIIIMIITSLENTFTWCQAIISLIFVLIMIIIIIITHPVGAQPCRGKRGDLFQPDLQHLQHRGTSGLFLCFLLLSDFLSAINCFLLLADSLSAINWHQSSFRYIDWKTLMRALFGDTGTHSSR